MAANEEEKAASPEPLTTTTTTQPPATIVDEDKENNQDDLDEQEITINLSDNSAGRIVNPLLAIPKDQLFSQVETFAHQHGLDQYVELLKKGALLAQRPTQYEEIAELTEDDKKLLAREHANRWDLPWRLYALVGVCCIGAAVQGWDQTGSNGANLSFPEDLGIAAPLNDPHYQRDQWLVGLINSMPYLASAFLGCWVSKPLNDYFGRRGCIFVSGIFLIVSPIASAFAKTWGSLLILRVMMGIGMGAKGSCVCIYAAEHLPTRVRTGLTATWQLCVALGLFLGFSANAIVAKTGDIAWRLQLGSAFIPAVPMTVGIYFCHESPRWLMSKNRYVPALKALLDHRHSDVQAASELYYAHCLMRIEEEISGNNSGLARFIELFTIPRVRRATLAAFIIMLAQQMCGINIIAFFSSTIFVRAGFTDLEALNVSIGFGALSVLSTIPANLAMDTAGTRFLLLVGFPNMFWTLLVTGLCFLISDADRDAKVGTIAFFLFSFTIAYGISCGPAPYAYTSEIFPIAQREQGMAFGVATTLFFAAILSMTFFRLIAVFGNVGAFLFYAGLNFTAFVLIFLFLPETKGKTLEEIDQLFSMPTRVFVRYQITKALPYFVRRWIWFDRQAKLEPLFKEIK